MSINFSIIIPCYNEKENLSQLITICKQELCSNGVEVILIDNGSNDDSQNILNKIDNSKGLLKTYKLENNRGYGGGILFGLSNATGNYIGWTHADLQTHPSDVLKGFNLMESNNTFIKGSRVGRPITESIFSIGMSIFESIILKKPLWEINAQPTIFAKSFFQSWKNPPNDFSLDLYAYVMAKEEKLKIKRFKVFFPKRLFGYSSWNTGLSAKIALIKRTIEFSFKLKKDISNKI